MAFGVFTIFYFSFFGYQQSDWRKAPEVAALVSQIAPRRIPHEEAVANIRRFASSYQGSERTDVLTEVFVGLFETLSAERNDIVRGIKRFYRRHYSGRRAWFWITLMKLKITIKLVRDLVRLRVGSDERTRAMVTQQVDAWKAVLWGVPEYAGANPKPDSGRRAGVATSADVHARPLVRDADIAKAR